MADLFVDVKVGSSNTVKFFETKNIHLHYSIRSLIELDVFYEQNCKDGKPLKNGEFAKDLGIKLFATGAYIGETIIKAIPGSIWEKDENEPENEVFARVKLPDGTKIWPIQRAIKKFRNKEDSIYVYGYHITKDHTQEPFDESYWKIMSKFETLKPWWKFW